MQAQPCCYCGALDDAGSYFMGQNHYCRDCYIVSDWVTDATFVPRTPPPPPPPPPVVTHAEFDVWDFGTHGEMGFPRRFKTVDEFKPVQREWPVKSRPLIITGTHDPVDIAPFVTDIQRLKPHISPVRPLVSYDMVYYNSSNSDSQVLQLKLILEEYTEINLFDQLKREWDFWRFAWDVDLIFQPLENRIVPVPKQDAAREIERANERSIQAWLDCWLPNRARFQPHVMNIGPGVRGRTFTVTEEDKAPPPPEDKRLVVYESRSFDLGPEEEPPAPPPPIVQPSASISEAVEWALAHDAQMAVVQEAQEKYLAALRRGAFGMGTFAVATEDIQPGDFIDIHSNGTVSKSAPPPPPPIVEEPLQQSPLADSDDDIYDHEIPELVPLETDVVPPPPPPPPVVPKDIHPSKQQSEAMTKMLSDYAAIHPEQVQMITTRRTGNKSMALGEFKTTIQRLESAQDIACQKCGNRGFQVFTSARGDRLCQLCHNKMSPVVATMTPYPAKLKKILR